MEYEHFTHEEWQSERARIWGWENTHREKYECVMDDEMWNLIHDDIFSDYPVEERPKNSSRYVAQVLSLRLTDLVREELSYLGHTPGENGVPIFQAAMAFRLAAAVRVRDKMYSFMDAYIENGARDSEPEGKLVEELAIIFDLPGDLLER